MPEPSDLSTGSKAILLIESYLADYPELRVERESGRLWVLNDDESGFDVGITDEGREVILWAGGWHGHYDDVEEAASCFMWLLTPLHRIALEYKGKLQVAWWLERFENEAWVGMDGGRALVSFILFGKKRTEYFQNHLINHTHSEPFN